MFQSCIFVKKWSENSLKGNVKFRKFCAHLNFGLNASHIWWYTPAILIYALYCNEWIFFYCLSLELRYSDFYMFLKAIHFWIIDLIFFASLFFRIESFSFFFVRIPWTLFFFFWSQKLVILRYVIGHTLSFFFGSKTSFLRKL